MKEKFKYTVLDCNQDGWATVEYENGMYGKIIKSFFIPLHKDKKVINGIIKNNIPVNGFVSRKNKFKNILTENVPPSGDFEFDLESEWYDNVVERIDMLDLSDGKKNEEENT